MIKIISIAFMALLAAHGLIHLMGLVAYWPLGKIAELPYKTTLLSGRWEVGASGMRLFSALWLLAALGFVTAAIALAFGRPWWAPILLGTVVLSLVVCILDWKVASVGGWVNVALLVLLFLVFGLRVKPAPYPAFRAPAAPVVTIPLPTGLPAPVERFYHQTYGDQIPVYSSAVMSGRGTVRLAGITFSGRMRFSHIAGKDYRHYFETCFYGLPVMKVNERYLDGKARAELPSGVVENDPGVDSAANQGLWAESLMFPAVLLTDARVRWEAIDDTHARLYVPFGDSEQVFTIKFDPQSGELTGFETVRYLDAKAGKLRWWGELYDGESRNGEPPNKILTAVWENEGTPWLIVEVEEKAFNADLSEYIRQRGP